MNHVFFLISIVCLATSCEELDPMDPGLLVPKTVDQDSSIPSITVNNTMLHAETFGDPSNPMIIFLHGGPGGDYRNALNVSQLASDGYYVVFYDQRGSGLSKRYSMGSYSIEVMFDDLTAVIDHYRTSPTQKVFLFGHSWGAMLATGYINKYPTKISGAILAEPGGFTWDETVGYVKRSKQIELFNEATNDALYVDQFFTGKENDHVKLDYKVAVTSSYSYAKGNTEGIEGPSPFWRFGAVVQKNLFEFADREGFDFTTHLDQYETDVLFLYSENNKAYGLSHAQRLANSYPNAEIQRIDDTGHEMIYFKWNTVYPLALNYFNSLN